MNDTPSPTNAANDLRAAAKSATETATTEAVKVKDRAVDAANAFKVSASEKADNYKAIASEKAEHYKSVATAKAQEVKDNAQKQWEDTRVKAKEMHVTSEDYIKQNPTKAVLGALGIGFLIGLIARR